MLRFIDGFDHYTSDAAVAQKYDALSGTSYYEIFPTTGRREGGCLQLYSGGAYARKSFEDRNTWIAGFAFKMVELPTSGSVIYRLIDSTGETQFSVYLTTSGALEARRGTSTILATSSLSLSAGVWYYIEVKATIHDTAGAAIVRVGEAEVINISGVDTKYTSTVGARTVQIGGINVALVYYDDYYICDDQGTANNNFLGDVRIDTLYPTAPGSSTDFTPTGSANNWDNVNDTNPDGDTGYNSSAVVGDTDLFAFSDLPAVTGTIFGVQANLNARKDDAGTGGMKPVVYLASTEYEGAEKAMLDSYFDHTSIWELNPNTAVAWTQSDINGAEFGYKVAS